MEQNKKNPGYPHPEMPPQYTLNPIQQQPGVTTQQPGKLTVKWNILLSFGVFMFILVFCSKLILCTYIKIRWLDHNHP